MRYSLIFCLFALTLSSSIYAEDTDSKTGPLTLLRAHQLSLQYDANARAARLEKVVQQEEIDKAQSAFLPQARLSLYQGRSSTDSQTPGFLGAVSKGHSVYDSSTYSLSVRQSIFNMASYAQYGQAKSETKRSEAALDSALSSLMSRVSGAYLDMLLSAENIHYQEAQKLSIEGQLKQAEQRYKFGSGTVTEINEAKANLETSNAKIIEYKNALENAKRALENITGLYPSEFLCLDPSKLSLDVPQPNRVEDWIANSLEKNPDILADEQALHSADYEVDKNQSGHYPTLDLVASRTETNSDTNYTSGSKYWTDAVGFQLNVPLYLGGAVTASVRQARAKFEELQEKNIQHQRDITANVRKYFNEVVNGIAKIQAFNQLVTSNEIALDGTQKAYLAGLKTNVDVLNAQEKLFSAKRDLVKERYLLVFNRLLLKQYAGLIKGTDIEEVSGIFTLPVSNKIVN